MRLSPEERILSTGVILDKLNALPLSAIIAVSDGAITVNGQELDVEKARTLRESALRVLENQAFKLCHEQVRWIAVQKGLATELSPSDLTFYRAALWYSEQLVAHLSLLAQKDQELALESRL